VFAERRTPERDPPLDFIDVVRRFRRMKILPGCLLFTLIAGMAASAQVPRVNTGTPNNLNALVLKAIARMPEGGQYSVSRSAHQALQNGMAAGPGGLRLAPERARPSYCSGATYLVFLYVVAELEKQGALGLDDSDRELLLARGQPDGVGVWGRWNANGPGTARLFAEMNLGPNFTDWEKTRPGDFMKIWWNNEVGKLERGHSVVYLGREVVNGIEQVRFWSSNKPEGYGEMTVPRTKIAWALFSRLQNPKALTAVTNLPKRDAYLASLLQVRSSRKEVLDKCRAQ
jgi:hypothetical protein